MQRDAIQERFRNLTQWRRGAHRAPHKPLMALYALGRLQRGDPRLIPYAVLDSALKELLAEFGPRNAPHGTHYPFWRMQRDQVWEVLSNTPLSVRARGDVSKGDLLDSHATGGFPEAVYRVLRRDPALVLAITQDLLQANFPDTLHDDILQAVGISDQGRARRDPQFRERILRAYEYRGAVCGFDVRLKHVPVALEAAHIKWHQAGGPDSEVNGLALCALHHKLFDCGAFTLSANHEILVSDRAHGGTGFADWLLRFHGRKIQPPQRRIYLPDEDFRTWHVSEVFKGYSREI